FPPGLFPAQSHRFRGQACTRRHLCRREEPGRRGCVAGARNRSVASVGMRTPFSAEIVRLVILAIAAMFLGGCGSKYPRAPAAASSSDYRYVIGPGHTVPIVVFRNADLSITVPVPPVGKTAVP